MKVTVIIPCYNFSEYIEQAILSVIAQKTDFDFEILISDDTSIDNSIDAMKRVTLFNENIEVFTQKKNLGANRNIEFLIKQAKGEYVAYLDGDDYWVDPYKLQKQIDFLDENPKYSMTFTGYWQKKADGSYIPELPEQWLCLPSNFENNDVTTIDLINGNWASYGRVFRNINGIVKEWMLNNFYFDWCVNFEISKHGKIKYLDFPGGVYRIHNNGIFSSIEAQKADEMSLKLRMELKERL